MAARMRGIEQAFAMLKEDDPGTELTLTGFRRLVTTGKIESVKVGKKYLVNYDGVLAYLSGATAAP